MGQNWERQIGMRREGFKERGERKENGGMIGEGEKGDKCRKKKVGDKKYTIQVSTQEMQEFGQKMVALCNYRIYKQIIVPM